MSGQDYRNVATGTSKTQKSRTSLQNTIPENIVEAIDLEEGDVLKFGAEEGADGGQFYIVSEDEDAQEVADD